MSEPQVRLNGVLDEIAGKPTGTQIHLDDVLDRLAPPTGDAGWTGILSEVINGLSRLSNVVMLVIPLKARNAIQDLNQISLIDYDFLEPPSLVSGGPERNVLWQGEYHALDLPASQPRLRSRVTAYRTMSEREAAEDYTVRHLVWRDV